MADKHFFETMQRTLDRKSTWLELFFDLVFVIAVAALSRTLFHNLTISGISHFVFLFIPIWWIWMGFSYYADQFEENNFWHNSAIFLAMLGVIILAAVIPKTFVGGSINFALTYIFLRALLIVLYLVAWYRHADHRALLIRYILGFSIGLFIWIASIFVPIEYRFLLWGIALVIEIATPLLAYITITDVPAQVSHMDERFGLFTLIVLGDTVVSVSQSITGTHWAWQGTINAIAGFCCAIIIWILYFDYADDKVIHRALRGGRAALINSFVYGYSHLFIFIGIVAFGVGVDTIVSHHLLITHTMMAVLFGGTILYLIAITIIQWTMGYHICSAIILIRTVAIILLVTSGILTSIYQFPFAAIVMIIILTLMIMSEKKFQSCVLEVGIKE